MDVETPTKAEGAALYVLSFRHLDELTQLACGAGWRVRGARRAEPGAFGGSGAKVAVVDARGAFEEGLAAVAALAPETDAAAAALLALVPRGDGGAIGRIYAAGATHFLLSPAAEGEFIHAIRFAERYAERLEGGGARAVGRRRDDPVPEIAAGDAARRWAAGRLAVGRPVVVARALLASFDLVNSAHGRAAGDLILDEAAERLKRVAGELFGGEAIVARRAGPEFLLAGDGARAAPDVLMARVGRALAEPYGPALVGARVGVAASQPDEDAAAIIRRAGEALSPAAGGAALDELAVDLHHAMTIGQIAVLFQPQLSIVDGRVIGAEALVRWDHPRSGEVGAETLFAAAARAGLASALSEHVQRLALEAGARWPAALSGLRLSVNVTAEDVGAADFTDRFLARVAAAGFPAARLTVEVTETGLIADLPHAGALLGRLREAGCRTAIDDFGAGYSSLAYLNALPLDYLKLDKALVSGVERDGRERVVVRAVLALARSLGLTTIAEGVETAAQRDLLAAEGCDLYQGFLCSGAVDTDTLATLVRRPPSPSPC